MTTLYVILGCLLALVLIGEIRIGCIAEYIERGVVIKAKFAFFQFDIDPTSLSNKEKKSKKEQTKQEKGGKLGMLLELLPVITEAVGALLRKIRINMLDLRLTWAADNPALAAMGYGAANAALGTIYPALEQAFVIKKHDIRIDINFDEKEPLIYGKAVVTITIGQIVILCLRYGMRALAVWNKRRKVEQDNKQ